MKWRTFARGAWHSLRTSAVTIAAFACFGSANAQSIPPEFLVAEPPGRKALVIANSIYSHHEPLPAAANDGIRMSQTLENLGFTVTYAPNIQTIEKFIYDVIAPFARKVERDDIVVIYYSGHGYSLNGFSFIAPTHLNDKLTKDNAAANGYPIENLYDEFQRARPGYVLVIFDACRTMFRLDVFDSTNNFINKGGGSVRNTAPGEANFAIHYATSLGRSAPAEGGPDGLSPFTRYLLPKIGRKDREYDDAVKDTNAALRDNSLEIGSTWEMRVEIDLLLNESEAVRSKYREMWLQQFNDALSANEQWRQVARFARREKLNPYVKAARRWLEHLQSTDTSAPSAITMNTNLGSTPSSGRTVLSPASVDAIWDAQSDTNRLFAMRFPEVNIALPRSQSRNLARDESFYQARSVIEIVENNQIVAYRAPKEVALDYANVLKEARLVKASDTLDLHQKPDEGSRIIATAAPTTPLYIDEIFKDSKGNQWASLKLVNSPKLASERLFAQLEIKQADRTSILGQNLSEIYVPQSQIIPGVIDASVIENTISNIKKRNLKITHILVTGSTIPIDHPRRQLLIKRRESELLNTGYHLRKQGVPGARISFLTEAANFNKPGVLLRIFGHKADG